MGDFWLTGTSARSVHIRRSVNHALTMFVAMLSAAFCWFFLRYPDDSILTITTNFKESELSGLHKGQAAMIRVRQYPGKVFHGVIEAVGFGTERRESSPSGLAIVASENEWFLLPQRFPVQIRVTDPEFPFHMGEVFMLSWTEMHIRCVSSSGSYFFGNARS